MFTRISKLKGFNNVLAGRDLAEIFKEGHVYSVREIAGEFILKDLGKHALIDLYDGQSLTTILKDGSHCLTEEEYELK